MSFYYIDQLIGLREKVVGHICERELLVIYLYMMSVMYNIHRLVLDLLKWSYQKLMSVCKFKYGQDNIVFEH